MGRPGGTRARHGRRWRLTTDRPSRNTPEVKGGSGAACAAPMNDLGEAQMKQYEKPAVVDLGSLSELTAGTGSLGSEDGIAKSVQVGVGGVAAASLGLLP